MDVKTAIETRFSVRKFKDQPVPPKILEELVRRANLAPSINNSQPWQFIAITNKIKIDQMADIVRLKVQEVFANNEKANIAKTVEYFSTVFQFAPAMIVVAKESYHAIADDALDHAAMNEMRRYPDIQSLGAAIENMLLSAVELGYGACWLSGLMVARKELEALLGITAPFELTAAVAVGVPDGEPRRRPKKPLHEIFILID